MAQACLPPVPFPLVVSVGLNKDKSESKFVGKVEVVGVRLISGFSIEVGSSPFLLLDESGL